MFDDLKLCTTSNSQPTGLINTFKMISGDIKIAFCLDKCAKTTFKRGKKVSSEGTELNGDKVI